MTTRSDSLIDRVVVFQNHSENYKKLKLQLTAALAYIRVKSLTAVERLSGNWEQRSSSVIPSTKFKC